MALKAPKALRLPPYPGIIAASYTERGKRMTVTPLPKTGGSSKFLVTVAKRGQFTLALSRTLCALVWQLQTPQAELDAAKRMAEAIVGRHDPKLPLKDKYIFAEHNSEPTLEAMLKFLRKTQL